MKRQQKSGWQTMSRFDRAALAVTGLLVAALYGLVASDSLSGGDKSKSVQQHLSPPLSPQSERGALTPAVISVTAQDLSALTLAKPYLAKPYNVYALGPATKITEVFSTIGYRLQDVRQHGEVPRIFVRNMPADLKQITLPRERKRVFIKLTLPLILHVNDVIRHKRARILSMQQRTEKGEALHVEEKAWLSETLTEYGLEKLDYAALLRRVDVVPPSLALAQSAEESGWGTSRFAREGNALFGQRIWKKGDDAAGIVPEKRPEGEQFRVKAFDHLIDGVKSYARNLNTHFAYKAFREARAAMRQSGERLNGVDLANALESYSTRGEDYIKTLHTIIRINDLTLFDGARLRDTLSARRRAPNT
ncbi:MAG: glucosaminidase domain-containing protein [Proteobacteria bacterium]|nr:glucosaminidase domain-containing protein [Pseudomonadota bacterium]